MLRPAIKVQVILSILLFCVLGVFAPRPVFGADTCSEGTGLPPFLGKKTVLDNLLLLIDNSYSMYDLVYAETRDECFDDSFNPTVFDYAGYFLTIDELQQKTEVWYEYDLASPSTNQFYRRDKDTTVAGNCVADTAAGEVRYGGVSPGDHVCLIMDESSGTQELKYFAATGEFLNWLSASRMDIQKLVFTGGEFVEPDDTSGYDDLVMPMDGDEYLVEESRGCNEYSMVKEINIKKNGSFTSPPTKLTLTVRADDTDADGDGNYHNTLIEIYKVVQGGGFDNESCQAAVDKFYSNLGVGSFTQPLQDCLGYDKDDELGPVYNDATQECWQMLNQGGPAPPYGTGTCTWFQ